MGKNRKALKKAEDTVVNDAQAAGQNVLDDAENGGKKKRDYTKSYFSYTMHEIWNHKMSYALIAPFFICFTQACSQSSRMRLYCLVPRPIFSA